MKRSLPLAAAWAAVVVIAVLVLYRPAWRAGGLSYRPDSVEYAAVGYRMAFQGTPLIPIEGKDLPARYSPWFSLLVATPAYRLLGPEPGNPIYPVTAIGVIGFLAVFGMGLFISGLTGGSVAVLCLLATPGYRMWGREILTDVPTAAVIAAAGWVYVRLATNPSLDLRRLALAGALAAVAFAFRPTAIAASFPFLFLLLSRGWARRPAAWVAAFGPVAAMIVATAVYQYVMFGSPLRTGYHFWAAAPYDYIGMTYSLSNLSANWVELRAAGVLWLAVAGLAGWLLLKRTRGADPAAGSAIAAMGLYAALAGGPIVLIHLLYYYYDARLFIPVVPLLAAVVGGLAGAVAPRRWAWLGGAALGVTLVVAIVLRAVHGDTPWEERPALERVRDVVRRDAVVVSAVDPLYLHFVFDFDPSVRVVPLSRRADFASTYVSPRKTENPQPPPRWPRDHRCPAFLANGNSREAIEIVADEDPGWLREQLRGGTRVYVNTAIVSPADFSSLAALERLFPCRRILPDLYELSLPVTGAETP